MMSIRACRPILAFVNLVGVVACQALGDTAPRTLDTTGSIAVLVDSLPASGVGGVWLQAPDGTKRYFQVSRGPNALLSNTAFGAYRLEFDTVWFRDSGTTTLRYDGSRWTATPIAIQAAIDRAHSADTIRVVYGIVTGGIAVSATGNEELWVEFLHADGTGCRCTSWGGNGLRVHGGGSVQDLLPGAYQVHFLPISYGPTPAGSGSRYVVVPSPSTVLVNVRAGELARAATVYTIQ